MTAASSAQRGQTVFETVALHAAARPQAAALSGLSAFGAGMRWTYAALKDDAERLAAGLIGAGARPGQTFAIVSDNHPATALAWLAGARCGAIPSIVNSLLRERELGWIFGNLQVRLVISDAAHLDLTRAALAAAGIDVPVVLNDLRKNAGRDFSPALQSLGDLMAEARYDGPLPRPEDVFEVTYTSGTTSNPKGVVLTHEAVLFRADQQQALYSLTEQDASMVATPIFHQSGSRDTVLLMWRCGGHVTVAPRFSASGYWKHAIEAGATYVCLVETMFLLLERQEPSSIEREHGIRRAMGAAPPDLQERMEARFGLRLIPGYGMTECGFPVARRPDMTNDELRRYREWAPQAVFAGWPVGENEARVVDENGRDVAEGEQGEIWIRSRGLLREYLRNPEASAAALKDGWLHTGDYGLRGPGGSMYFVDRLKDMMRRGGENIASKEVEAVLLAHPKSLNAVVYPVPDPLFVQEVKAIVVPKPGMTATAEEYWSYCDEHLARYKVPRYIEFRSELPLGGSGRVQKQALRAEPIAGHGATHDRTTGGVVPAA
jgi:acyl-CoA synthetase (AMP-forming)/AMP-acid ligase II